MTSLSPATARSTMCTATSTERGWGCRGLSHSARSHTSCSTRRWSTATSATQPCHSREGGTWPSRWPRRVEPRRSAVLTTEGGAAPFPSVALGRETLPGHRPDVPRPLLRVPLSGSEQLLVFLAPRFRHVSAEMGGGHHLAPRPRRLPEPYRRHVAEEAGRAAGVHHVRNAALEVSVAVVQHGSAERAQPVRDGGELVAHPPAHEPQRVDQLELVCAQQMEHEAPGLEDQVVTEVELVDVDRKAGDRGHDRGAHGRVRDHAVALAAALRGDRDHGRSEVPQELVDLIRPHRVCPGVVATLSLYHGEPPRPRPRT